MNLLDGASSLRIFPRAKTTASVGASRCNRRAVVCVAAAIPLPLLLPYASPTEFVNTCKVNMLLCRENRYKHWATIKSDQESESKNATDFSLKFRLFQKHFGHQITGQPEFDHCKVPKDSTNDHFHCTVPILVSKVTKVHVCLQTAITFR